MSRLHAAKKKRYDANDADLLKKVSSEIITKETLSERLAQHVEQVSLVEVFFFFFSSSVQEQRDFSLLEQRDLLFCVTSQLYGKTNHKIHNRKMFS